MSKRPSRGVSSGVGSPMRMSGRDGDLTIRKTKEGKILYVKEHGSWHPINTGVDTAQLKKDVDRLIRSVNTLRNDNNPYPTINALNIRKNVATATVDPKITFTLAGVDIFTMGVNDSLDSPANPFQINNGSTLDDTSKFELDASGNIEAAGHINIASGKSFKINGSAIAITDTTYSEATGSAEGLMSIAHHDKLDTIEESADVTDTTNVTSAGALMDSECSSLADVKALNQSVISGATPTFTATNFTDASNKRFMSNAQETKLDSVESSADVTDATNVTAAGALMDSELTDLAGIKGLTVGDLASKDAVNNSDWSGTDLSVGNGGTGAGTFTNGGVLLGSGTGAITATAVLGDGEVLIGDGTTDPVALDVGSSTAITILGTVGTGTWQGTAIASAYLDTDTAHLSGSQTFTGRKGFNAGVYAVKYIGFSHPTEYEWGGVSGNLDIDFNDGNKRRMRFITGDDRIVDNLNLIFPNAVSGNFMLIIKNGTDLDDGSAFTGCVITNWKVFDTDTGTEGEETEVVWHGGSSKKPTISIVENHVDIISFYWDSDEQIAYGQAGVGFY